MNGFDISQQPKTVDETTVVHLIGLDDKPLFFDPEDGTGEQPVTITVVGIHSRKVRRFDEAMRKRRIKPRNLTGEALLDDSIERAAAGTIEWQGFHSSGEALECVPKNVKKIYADYPWVLEQVVDAMNDHSRFFGNSSTEQSTTSDTSHD